MPATLLHVPAAIADVLDRISILSIKAERIMVGDARANVLKELALLCDAWGTAGLGEWRDLPETPPLLAVNSALWDVEDRLRDLEAQQDFGVAFVAAARQVYHLNDRRAAIKQGLNRRLGSAIIEEKSYCAREG